MRTRTRRYPLAVRSGYTPGAMTEPGFLHDGPRAAAWTLVLAHGAGQPADSDFMTAFARGLAARGERLGGLHVVRFDFPYMDAARQSSRRRAPDREPVLLESWRSAIRALERAGVRRDRLVVGGKSLGGRMASMLTDEEGVAGLVCLGYPFHPPGRPERLRTAHLEHIRTPTLICQGTRDPFGGESEVPGYRLPPTVRVHWVPDGEHDFRPRRASGRTEQENRETAMNAVVSFIASLP